MKLMASDPSDTRVLLGVIAGAHGLRGQVRVRSFTAEPEDVTAYGPLCDGEGTRRFALRITGRSSGTLIGSIEGIESRDSAEALKGTELYVARETLPEPSADEFYHADLVGLRVEDESGAVLGTVKAVHDHGAGTFVEVAPEDGGETRLLPFSRAGVPVVDLAAGRLVVAPADETDADEPDGQDDGNAKMRGEP
jgi:16S rRNA processing protein RimM